MTGGKGGGGGSRVVRWLTAVFRTLLLVLPRDFRQGHGDDVARLFADRCEEARVRRGAVWATVVGASGVLDLMTTGVRERWDSLTASGAYDDPVGTRRTKMMILDEIRQDGTMLLRHLRRRPGFGAVLLLTLAVGVGVSTGVFSVVQSVLLSPLPFPESDELVAVLGGGASSLPNFRDMDATVQGVEPMAGAIMSTSVLTGAGDPVQLPAASVSSDFFGMLGVSPVAGRLLDHTDQAQRRVVLGHGLWARRFGGDPGVVGRTVTLDGESWQVVGVAPASLNEVWQRELWIPFQWAPGEGGFRGQRNMSVYGRLAQGRTLAAANQEVAAAFQRLAEEYPDVNGGRWSARIEPLKDTVVGDQDQPLKLLLGASLLFLLIACINAGSLFLTRLESRQRELAVSAALGAGRARLLRQAWTEVAILAFMGGLFGLTLAALLVDVSVDVFGGVLSRQAAVGLNSWAVGFALAASAAGAGIVSLVAAMGWQRTAPARVLQRASSSVTGRMTPLRRAVIAGELALALILVTGLGLLVKSFHRIQSLDLGLRTEEVMTVTVGELPHARYDDAASQRAFLDQLQARLEGVPGVESTALAVKLPLSGCCLNGGIQRADATDESGSSSASYRPVSPEYFEVLGIEVLAGRGFTGADLPDGPEVAVVNRRLATTLFGSVGVVGERLNLWGTELEIVGVVEDVRELSPVADPPRILYLPLAQAMFRTPGFLVRTALTRAELTPIVRGILADVDPLVPLSNVRPLADLARASTGDRRVTTYLMAFLGVMALALGAVGIYGVVSQAVTGQTREFGLRMALGASRSRVTAAVLRRAVVLLVPGVLLGVAGALALNEVMVGLLYEVSPFDPWVYAGVLGTFLAVAVLSAVAPARRAASVEPVEALREV